MQFKDLSEREKASLSRSEIDEYIEKEIMARGIKKYTDEPGPEPKMPALKTKPYWQIGGLHFPSIGAAQKVADLKPLESSCNWSISNDVKYVNPYERGIKRVELPDRDEVDANTEAIAEWDRIHSDWQIRNSCYESYHSSRSAVIKEILEGWNAAKRSMAEIRQIEEAWEEYKSMAGGSEEVAMKFLVKTFGQEKVNKALGITQPQDQNQDSKVPA